MSDLFKLNFKYFYTKLENDEFTTVRGKYFFKKLKPGQLINVTLRRNHFCFARVIKLELKKIKDMSLEFLQNDADTKTSKIKDHAHFIRLINSFVIWENSHATMESEKTIIYFEKIKE